MVSKNVQTCSFSPRGDARHLKEEFNQNSTTLSMPAEEDHAGGGGKLNSKGMDPLLDVGLNGLSLKYSTTSLDIEYSNVSYDLEEM